MCLSPPSSSQQPTSSSPFLFLAYWRTSIEAPIEAPTKNGFLNFKKPSLNSQGLCMDETKEYKISIKDWKKWKKNDSVVLLKTKSSFFSYNGWPLGYSTCVLGFVKTLIWRPCHGLIGRKMVVTCLVITLILTFCHMSLAGSASRKMTLNVAFQTSNKAQVLG